MYARMPHTRHMCNSTTHPKRSMRAAKVSVIWWLAAACALRATALVSVAASASLAQATCRALAATVFAWLVAVFALLAAVCTSRLGVMWLTLLAHNGHCTSAYSFGARHTREKSGGDDGW